MKRALPLLTNLMKEKCTHAFLMLHKKIEQHSPTDDTLLGGRLGLALYYQALYEAFGKHTHGEKAVTLLEQVIAQTAGTGMQLSGNTYGNGGAGLGYMITGFYNSGLVDANLIETLETLDDFLYTTSLEQITRDDNIDFLHGAAGTIHYFIQRLPDPKIETLLTNLVTALCNRAIKTDKGLWFRNTVFKKKEINLSLSHGLCSFLIVLINAWHAGIRPACIKETVEGGINFILAHQLDIDIPKEKWSLFPDIINVDNPSVYFPSRRLAWCYGDFGPILLLYKAAAVFNNKVLLDKANLFGTFTIMRKDADATAATEALFCHGTAGIAQVYDTFYKLSGINKYKVAQGHWINETINMLVPELEKDVYAGKECNFLEGLVGINLSLLSYISPQPLSWAQSLLLE
jgi:lantibiotic modifying enzyme